MTLTRQQRVAKLIKELQIIQEQKVQFAQNDKQWWQLECQAVAIQHVLTNLTSLCQFCQQEGAETKFSDGSFICRPCLLSKHQEYFLMEWEKRIRRGRF